MRKIFQYRKSGRGYNIGNMQLKLFSKESNFVRLNCDGKIMMMWEFLRVNLADKVTITGPNNQIFRHQI